jgi:hypothetical protein
MTQDRARVVEDIVERINCNTDARNRWNCILATVGQLLVQGNRYVKAESATEVH